MFVDGLFATEDLAVDESYVAVAEIKEEAEEYSYKPNYEEPVQQQV